MQTRTIIRLRAKDCCERCTGWDGAEIHHRRPRGAGGSKDQLTNIAANGVLLCPACHRFIERYRTKALREGWLVRQGQDPRDIPVFYRGSSWAYLTMEGEIRYVNGEDARLSR